MTINFIKKLGCIYLLALVTLSCSKDDNESLEGKGSHTVSVFPIKVGLSRSSDIKIFVSEQPFESYDKFESLGSVSVPEQSKVTDSINVNVSKYVGKTLFFTPLRKHLLSDNYYAVAGKSSPVNSVLIEDSKPEYKVSLILTEPESGSYTYDEAHMTLTVQKGAAPVANKEVYWYGTSFAWGPEMIRSIENRYMIDQSVVQTSMGKTKTDGTVRVSIPVNEKGITSPGTAQEANHNEHVFFVLENGKVKPVLVDVNALTLSQTLQY